MTDIEWTPESAGPASDRRRLDCLLRYRILDTPPDPAFEAVVDLAASVSGCSMAGVSFVDADRVWFKARRGIEAPGVFGSDFFCFWVVATDSRLNVPDVANDARFAACPPGFGAYAGAPIRGADDLVVGTVFVADAGPRSIDGEPLDRLATLAGRLLAGRLVEADNESLRRKVRRRTAQRRRAETDSRRRARQQAIVAEFGQRALAGSDLGELLQAATERIADALHVELVAILRLEDEAASTLAAGVGWRPELLGRPVGADHPAAGCCLPPPGDAPVVYEELALGPFADCPLLAGHEAVSGAVVAIPLDETRPFGLLGAHATSAREFSEMEVQFLQSMAHLLGMAIRRRRHEVELQRTNQLLDALGRAHLAFISEARPERIFGDLLGDLIDLSGSAHGFLAEVLRKSDGPRILRTLVDSDRTWFDRIHEACGEDPARPRDFARTDSAIGRALETGRPAGSTNLLVLPIDSGDEVIGVVAIADRPGGYDPDLVDSLRPFLSTCSTILDAVRTKAREKRLEAQIQYAQKLESLGVLAGGIAHDFNNLLMGILGNASLVLRTVGGDDPLRTSLERIETSARRAADLTNQLLAYSGKGRFLVEPIDLSRLTGEMVDLLQMSITRKARLRLGLADDLPTVEGDATQLRQVVMNLLTNASDALGQGDGEISIATRALDVTPDALREAHLEEDLSPGRHVLLEVSDSGTGMDAVTISRLFEPFFTTKFTGRGLGMAAVQGIIRSHRGAIRVESSPGGGTRVQVYLPASDRPLAKAPVEAAENEGWTSSAAVLVVDDQETVLETARSILEAFGFTVTTAPGGSPAIALVEADPAAFDLVLLDLTMPDLDGETVFVELRRVRPDLPIVLSSGYAEVDIAVRFAAHDLSGFIQKPYRPADLIACIRQVLPAR